ncbi:MAG: hypothetical protein K2I82_04455 [Ruminococcus sp.]|nr:hypothetical protein [Ruminococcus sp.]
MKYKTESQNTTQFINLHDCQCQHLSYKNSKIVLEMEWIEVLGKHPENPYGMAHSSDKGFIELNDGIIIDYIIDYGNNSTANIEINKPFKIDDIEIYSYSENNKINSEYKYAEISALTPDNFIMLEILFKESCVKWNNLDDVSWFESEKNQKADKHIKEVVKMLSCNNFEEVQAEGLKLASDVRYLGHFFQPSINGESESLWNNCALVLSKKTDEELTDYLLWCFI